MKKKYTIFKASSIVEIGFSCCALVWIYKYATCNTVTGGVIGEFDQDFDKF